MHKTNNSRRQSKAPTSLPGSLSIFAMMSLLIFAPQMAMAQGEPEKNPTANVAGTLSAGYERPKDGVQEEQGRGGPHEGIKVNGYWVIDVRNPDGSLVSHTEFENSVDPNSGTPQLAGLLKQVRTAGHWAIRLGGTRTPGAQPACTGGAAVGTDCWIVQPGSLPTPFNAPGAGISTNLTVTLTGTNQDQLVFSGSLTVPADGKIDFVNTWQGFCPADVAPQNCTTITGGPLTFFPLDPIVLQQGRIIQVTVTLSFS